MDQPKKRHGYGLFNWSPRTVIIMNALGGIIILAALKYAIDTTTGTPIIGMFVGAANGAILGFTLRAFDPDFSLVRVAALAAVWGVPLAIFSTLGGMNFIVLVLAFILTVVMMRTGRSVKALIVSTLGVVGAGYAIGVIGVTGISTLIRWVNIVTIAQLAFSNITFLVIGTILGAVRGIILIDVLRAPRPLFRETPLSPGVYTLGDDGELVEMPEAESPSAPTLSATDD